MSIRAHPWFQTVLACLAVLAMAAVAQPQSAPAYSIHAIRYATVPQFPLASLIPGAPRDQRVDIAMAVWLIRGDGRTILFDSGFHREKWMQQFNVKDFLSPDAALREAGVDPASVTDVIISHAHWDHMGGIDLFPQATLWIQKAEYEYYTGAAWQPGGRKGGIDEADIRELVSRNLRGKVRLVDGDDKEILPGIRAYTGARHTFASQYIRVAAEPAFVLASDNCYLYENLRSRRPSATFERSDEAANLAAQKRMAELAGDEARIVPGHDLEQFQKFPTRGRMARIR